VYPTMSACARRVASTSVPTPARTEGHPGSNRFSTGVTLQARFGTGTPVRRLAWRHPGDGPELGVQDTRPDEGRHPAAVARVRLTRRVTGVPSAGPCRCSPAQPRAGSGDCQPIRKTGTRPGRGPRRFSSRDRRHGSQRSRSIRPVSHLPSHDRGYRVETKRRIVRPKSPRRPPLRAGRASAAVVGDAA
jgi:hypothetical protein